MLKCYKITFDNSNTTEIYTSKSLTEDFLKSEIEKLTTRKVTKIMILENAKKYDVTKTTKDLYYSVDFDVLGVPMYFNRILIPECDGTDEILVSKMKRFIENIYPINTKVRSLKF